MMFVCKGKGKLTLHANSPFQVVSKASHATTRECELAKPSLKDFHLRLAKAKQNIIG